MEDGSLYCCVSDKAFSRKVLKRFYTECGHSLRTPPTVCSDKCLMANI